MSLNWDVSKVNSDALTDGEEWAKTQALIWTTIGVGMGEITEENYVEFTVRQEVMVHLYRIQGMGALSLDDVKLRIGLKTNVTTETRAQFLKRVVSREMDDRVRSYKSKEEN